MSSGSERRSAPLLAGLVCALGVAAPAAAQTCRDGTAAWLGVTSLACNCTNATADGGGWQFRSEPEVRGVDLGGPAAGLLRTGDVVVAVDGFPITTAEGGRRFSAAAAAVRLTVRRGDRLVEVEIPAVAVCRGDPRVAFAPRALGGKAALARGAAPEPAGAGAAGAARPGAFRSPVGASAPPDPGRLLAPRPPTALPGPDGGRMAAWFGFGMSCRLCGWETSADGERRWFFGEQPTISSVEPGSPAAAAGLAPGDVLTHIDGRPLTSDDGGRLFGNVLPGSDVRWTVRRRGAERQITMRAAPTMEPPVRYQGVLGDAEIEVRGLRAVSTTVVEPGREVIIDTGDSRIRIRLPPPDRRRLP
jgi:hypothetical protein